MCGIRSRSASFDPSGRFPLVYATSLTLPTPVYRYPIHGQFMTYDPAAKVSSYGVNCGAGRVGTNGTPNAGNEFFDVVLGSAPPQTSAFLFIANG